MGFRSDYIPQVTSPDVRTRLHLSDRVDWPLCLTRWIGGCRWTHVHLEVEGWALMGSRSGSRWLPIGTVSRVYPHRTTIDLGRRPVDIPRLLALTEGWTCTQAVVPHLRWWFLRGPMPMNCVRLTALALGLCGIEVRAETPDQLHDELQAIAEPAHHAGSA